MSTSPRFSIAYLQPQQAQKHVTVNAALRRLDALVSLAVKSRSLGTEPAAPAEGDAYILPAGPTGAAWPTMSAGSLAVFQDGVWAEITPVDGLRAFVSDEGRLLAFSAGAWSTVGGADTLPQFGVNTAPDPINRLAVKSDAVLFSHDDITPGSGDIRHVINKAAAGGTASVMFQNGASGRAEIGLTGDDSLHLKVSADGAAWNEALFADNTTGSIGVGTSSPASRLHVYDPAFTLITLDSGSPGAGAAFDIVNSSDGSSWRVTGQSTLFKLRDHTAGLDKLTLKAGAGGDAYFDNIGNLGVGTTAPSTKLHVAGSIRIGASTVAGLPSASGAGAGAMIYVTNESGGPAIAFSDGTNWRRVQDRAVVS